MRNSLYLRMVITFIFAVVIGLFIAFFIVAQQYKSQILIQAEQDVMKAGQEIIKLSQKADIEDIDGYLESMPSFQYNISLYSKNGPVKFYGVTPQEAFKIEQEEVQRVLEGGTIKKVQQTRGEIRRITIGLPFQINGQQLAMFLEPNYKPYAEKINKALNTVLLIILLVGSIIFIFAARYLVKPLKMMTEATKELAKGNFEVQVKIQHHDELGILAESFNRMAKELSQLDKMRNEFISNVSHEIRSPLTSIQGFSQAIQDGAVTEEEKVEYLQIIQNEAERLSKLSENLLRLATLDAEQYPLNPKVYSLDEQIRRVIVAQQPQWAAKKIEFNLTLPKTMIFADELQLAQVWINLITNSIKYTPPGGKIKISLQEEGDKVLVAIADSGIGIPEAEQQNIFQRFYTVDKSRSRAFSGSGLGLAIAQKIVTLHEGKITLHSKVNEGSKFMVTIPKKTPS